MDEDEQQNEDDRAATTASQCARSLVAMRLYQPVGSWFEGEDQDRFFEMWTEGFEASEDAFVLTLVNMAAGLLRWLEEISGKPAAAWLQDWATEEASYENGGTT